MRALFNQIVRDRKIILSIVFSLAIIGTASFSQDFIGHSSKVFGATALEQGNPPSLIQNGGSETQLKPFGGEGGEGKVGGTGELCGFAWGSTGEAIVSKMGVGWVSFNSKDCDIDGNGVVDETDTKNGASSACPLGEVSEYKVSVDDAGNLNGYAWSSNVGWLKFGGLSDFPKSEGGNDPQDARINGDGTVTGWARFCAGTEDGQCESMNARNDGWDGWVSLRGTSPNYGVTVSGDNFSGYSWGSDVVGWLNWNAGTGNNVRYCTGAPDQGIVVTLNANPSHGPVVLHTQLTANYQVTSLGQKMVAQLGNTPSYRFKCDYSDNWSDYQSSNTYSCTYSSAGTHYFPRAEVKLGALTSEGAAEVVTDDENPGPTGTLHAKCEVTRPAFVGFPVTWKVTIDQESVGPYDYVVDLTGESQITVLDTSETTMSFVRTYPGPGPRSINATITDSNSSPTTVTCGKDVSVIVRPTIIPI